MIAKIGTFDFTEYVRGQAGDGLDPYGAPFADPQFTESAFGIGQALASTAIGNREQVWPLYLNEPDTNALHDLVIDLGRELAQDDLTVEWRAPGADTSTFYTVETARFDPSFDMRKGLYGWLAGTLRVWCNPPYGHTGTYRVVATAAGGSAAARIALPSLAGDVPAALDLTARRGGSEALAHPGRTLAVGVLPHPSMAGIIPAASMVPGVGATIASGMVQFPAIYADRNAVGRAQVHLSPGSVYAGRRMRVLALAETNSRSGLRVTGVKDGATLGHQMATAVNARELLDLGAMDIPRADSRATHTVDLLLTGPVGSGVYGDIRSADVAAGLHALMVIPEESLTVVRDRQGALVAFDDTLTPTARILTGRRDNLGNEWQADPAEWQSLLVGTFSANRIDNHGITATSPLAGGGANILAHRPLADFTANVGIAPDGVRWTGYQVKKFIDHGLHQGMATYSHSIVGAELAVFGNGLSAPSAILYLTVSNASAFQHLASGVIVPSLNAFGRYPAMLQLVQRGDSVSARVYTADGHLAQTISGTHAPAANPGVLRTLMNHLGGSAAPHNSRIVDVEVLSTPSVLMSPTDTYRVGPDAYRSHPSHGYSGEVVPLGADLLAQPGDAAVVVAMGGHELADRPSVNDVTIRAQERFTIAR